MPERLPRLIDLCQFPRAGTPVAANRRRSTFDGPAAHGYLIRQGQGRGWSCGTGRTKSLERPRRSDDRRADGTASGGLRLSRQSDRGPPCRTGGGTAMSTINSLVPRQPVPALEVATAGGGTWRLADQRPETFTLVVFYRGLHCPICASYLGDLNRKAGDFAERGVGIVVISSDGAEPRRRSQGEMGPGQARGRLRPRARQGTRVGALYLLEPRRHVHRHRRAGPVHRAGALSGTPRRHALLRDGANHALRPAAFRRHPPGPRFRSQGRLSGPRRDRRPHGPQAA